MARTHDTGVRILAIERMMAAGRRMTLKEIQRELEQKYEIHAHRDTIREDIYTLNLFVPIESYTGHNGGYQRVDVLARCKD
jgi:predicted DNA-binding transcriptional regulator YafY